MLCRSDIGSCGLSRARGGGVTGTDQCALFTAETPSAVASDITYQHTDPAAGEATLTGDGYGWLAAPAPCPPTAGL
jgi:hypothetical protein